METLNIQNTTVGETSVLRLDGPLTLSTLFDFQDAVRQPGVKDTIIDLTGVPYIDSAGLGAVLAHWAHTQRNNDKLALAGVNDRVRVLLEITKTNTLLPAFQTVDDALQSFQQQARGATQSAPSP